MAHALARSPLRSRVRVDVAPGCSGSVSLGKVSLVADKHTAKTLLCADEPARGRVLCEDGVAAVPRVEIGLSNDTVERVAQRHVVHEDDAMGRGQIAIDHALVRGSEGAVQVHVHEGELPRLVCVRHGAGQEL